MVFSEFSFDIKFKTLNTEVSYEYVSGDGSTWTYSEVLSDEFSDW